MMEKHAPPCFQTYVMFSGQQARVERVRERRVTVMVGAVLMHCFGIYAGIIIEKGDLKAAAMCYHTHIHI